MPDTPVTINVNGMDGTPVEDNADSNLDPAHIAADHVVVAPQQGDDGQQDQPPAIPV